MMKRIVIVSVIVAIIAAFAVFYFVTKPEPVVDSVYRAVPLDAVVLMDFKDYNTFRDNLENHRLWNELANFPLFSEMNRKIKFADSLININPDVSKLLSEKIPFLISGHPAGKDDLKLIYYFKIEEKKDFSKIDDLIRGFHNKLPEVVSRSYEDATIYDVTFPVKTFGNFSYTWSHGLLMISSSSILLEDAIRQLSAQESLLNKKDLTEIIKTSGKNATVNLYFNLNYFPQLAQKLVLTENKKETGFLKDLGSWMELDLNVKQDVIMFNGFSISGAGNPGIISLFSGQKPLQLQIFNKIPASAHTFLILGLDKYVNYQREYSKIQAPAYKNTIKELQEKYSIDLSNRFADIFDQEVALAFTGTSKDSIGKGALTIIKTRSSDDASKFISSIISEYSVKNDSGPTNTEMKVKNESKESQIWKLPFLNLPSLVLGKMFDANNSQYCLIHENLMVFAENQETLIRYLLFMNQNASIGTDLEFNSFSDYFSSRSNFFFYTKPSAALDFYYNICKEDIMAELSRQQEHLSKIGSIVYQFNVTEQNLIYHNIFIKYSAGTTTKTDYHPPVVNTNTDVEGKIIHKPILIKGLSEGKEALVVDDKNQVSLVNSYGRVVWKVKLTDPIVSDIYTIDYYHNKKQQFLFNTNSKIYLLDHDGKPVANYPVKLQDKATNGLAVFDYEKNGDYRFAIATDEKEIRILGKNGTPVNQWNPEKTRKNVTQPAQFFRIQEKDYIVYNDSKNLYIVDRKGKKIATSEDMDLSKGNPFYLINSRSRKEARFICSGKSGEIYSVNLEGRVNRINIGSIPAEHWFEVFDIDGDQTKEFIFSWDRTITVYNQKSKKILQISVPAAIKFKPQLMMLKGKCFIGAVCENRKIYFYTNKGQLCSGFPLKGESQFSVDVLNTNENKLNLVVGNNNNLLYENFVL